MPVSSTTNGTPVRIERSIASSIPFWWAAYKRAHYVKKEPKDIKVTASSNHVSDAGHPNKEEVLAKAELAMLISAAIKSKKLTQKQAVELIGVDQPKISAIIRGQLSGFTIDRLFRFLMALGMDIIIEIKSHTSRRSPVNIRVIQSQPVKKTGELLSLL